MTAPEMFIFRGRPRISSLSFVEEEIQMMQAFDTRWENGRPASLDEALCS
jgi:hypothetical protein